MIAINRTVLHMKEFDRFIRSREPCPAGLSEEWPFYGPANNHSLRLRMRDAAWLEIRREITEQTGTHWPQTERCHLCRYAICNSNIFEKHVLVYNETYVLRAGLNDLTVQQKKTKNVLMYKN